MKRTIASFLAAIVLAAVCMAQSSTDTQAGGSAAQKPAMSVPPGSIVQVELVKPLDAKKNKPGDEIVAKVVQSRTADGQVPLPKGSKVMGKVTQAQGRAKGQDESQLGIAFDSAVLKDGTQVPVSFTIQAVANSAAAMADAAAMAQGTSSAISMSNTGGGRPGLGSAAPGAAGTDLHAGNSASTNMGGELTPTSQGAIGLPGCTLSSGSLITSTTSNVRLERETRMILRVNGQ